MSEKCKCGKNMRSYREYQEDGFSYYEHVCQDESCDKKIIYQVCDNCEHETSWWED